MIKFNKQALRDKIYACWVGKNIGGTMGTPFEGTKELLDIKGFSTPEGTVLPNDDLDLQLVWLRALNEQGPWGLTSKVLGEYWINFIGPSWNEYGIAKANMRAGILPPMSGALYNDEWTNSNGAWIRTEIWACSNPGCPENAIRLAFEDASVDHGYGEGSYGAIFVAAMESAAFIFNDINVLIDIGLSKIPKDCRVARSVNLVIDAYKKGIDWKTVRNMIVDDSKDLGWFQAPANIAYVILGLLYGEGDFKKSMILGINCGDDTDCTGATIGSIMGIMYGTKIIPEDWRRHIGDSIVTISIIRGYGDMPTSCTELTDMVMEQIPICTHKNFGLHNTFGEFVKLVDDEDDFGDIKPEDFCGDDFVKKTFNCSKYSVWGESVFAKAVVDFDTEPRIVALGELKCFVTVKHLNNFGRQDQYNLKWYLPDGWSVSGRKNLFANAHFSDNHDFEKTEITITAGEKVEGNNRIILEVTNADHAMPILVPIIILG